MRGWQQKWRLSAFPFKRLICATAISTLVTLLPTISPAFASTCAANTYYYVGRYNTAVVGGYNGIERYISHPNDVIYNVTEQHLAYYFDISENTNNCVFYAGGPASPCWAQIGIGYGHFGDYSSGGGNPENGNTAYFEFNSPLYGNNGPILFTSPYGLEPNTFFTEYYNGLKSGNYYEFQGVYGSPNGAYYFPNLAYLSYDNGYPEAISEAYNSLAGVTCPAMTYPGYPPTYYGTNGSGTVTSNTWIDWTVGGGYPNNWQQANLPAYANTFIYHVWFYNGGSPGDAFYTYGS
jgi:hypothetical protein